MSDVSDRVERRPVDRLESPRDLLAFELGVALQMEGTLRDMLAWLAGEAHGDAVARLLGRHLGEARMQLQAVEHCFALLGLDAEDQPCLAVDAIGKRVRSDLRAAGEDMVDAVILGGVAKIEHHEVAVYEALVALAEATGDDGVAATLRETLLQETRALDDVQGLMAAALRGPSAEGTG